MASTLTPRFRACADKAIQRALGKPWVVMARGPDSFDCWGFVIHVMRQAGVELPDFVYEAGASKRAELFRAGHAKALDEGFQRVAPKTPYSVVLLGNAGTITHVAIYHPSGVYYHSMERFGVIGHRHEVLAGIFDTFTYWWC